MYLFNLIPGNFLPWFIIQKICMRAIIDSNFKQITNSIEFCPFSNILKYVWIFLSGLDLKGMLREQFLWWMGRGWTAGIYWYPSSKLSSIQSNHSICKFNVRFHKPVYCPTSYCKLYQSDNICFRHRETIKKVFFWI